MIIRTLNWWRQKNSLNSRVDDENNFLPYQIKEDDGNGLKLHIPLDAILRIQAFVDECPDEISGLGEIKTLVSQGFELNQPFILEQPVTGASTDITESAANFVYELAEKGQSPAPYKFWWHSHVNMDVFWSSEDEATARGFGNVFMISMVINRRKEFLIRLDQFEPFRLTIYNIPVVFSLPENPDLITLVKQEIKDKIQRPYYHSQLGSFFGRKSIFSAPRVFKPVHLVKPVQETEPDQASTDNAEVVIPVQTDPVEAISEPIQAVETEKVVEAKKEVENDPVD
jgi:hypothetical protein